MKKILLFLSAAILFCGCDKIGNGDCPVTEVSLPTETLQPGATVAIQGVGFTDESQIWLNDVQTAVTEVSETSIVFTAPEVYGEQTVFLKQDGGKWKLGTLRFIEKETPGCPVTEIVLPTETFQPGAAVTIQGKGFTAESQIWVEDTQATVTEVSETAIVFTAPEVAGSRTIILKQGGQDWTLGKITFAEGAKPEFLPKKLVRALLSSPEWGDFDTNYSYDENGRLIQIKKITETTDVIDFEYSASEVILKYDWGGEQIFSLENGRVVSNRFTRGDDSNYQATYSYGSNGHMDGFVYTTEYEGEPKETYDASLTVENQFLKTYYIAVGDFNYTINSVPDEAVRNNLNLDLLGYDDFLNEFSIESYSFPLLLGIGGERSSYLPKQYRRTDTDGDDYIVKFEYEFDGDYLSTIRIDYDGAKQTLKLYYEE